MTLIIFLIILLVLVNVHEAGHFFAARIFGIRVDEFAFGFPPKIASIKGKKTKYIFNALPLGGYVKIHGENGEGVTEKKDKTNFVNRHPLIKIFVLAAGVIMNLVLAFVLVSIALYQNTTFQIDGNTNEYHKFLSEGRVKGESLVIMDVVKNSPGDLSHIKVGDEVVELYLNKENAKGEVVKEEKVDLSKDTEEIVNKIVENINPASGAAADDSVSIVFKSKENNKVSSTTLSGVYGMDGNSNKKIIGLSFGKFANVKLLIGEAIKMGFERTVWMTEMTVKGFGGLLKGIFTGKGVSENITGPVGIFGLVKQASGLGINYLLNFAAVLSISLAVFNILPFPALDGGRILFVLIEWISGKKISEKWQNILNGAGFVILILLMILISVKDVLKLIH